MLTYSEPKLEIVKCDNGYVVEWRDESRRKNSATWPETPAAGVKIFPSKKEVVKYLTGFFAGE